MSDETSIRDQTMNNKRLLPRDITSQQEARKLLKTQPEQELHAADWKAKLAQETFICGSGGEQNTKTYVTRNS